MKYENYGLIKEGWDKFVVSEQSAHALLESLTDEEINEMLYATIIEAIPGAHIRDKNRGLIQKMIDKFKQKAAQYGPMIALTDFVTDLPQTGMNLDIFLHSPLSTALITYAIMRAYKLSKADVIKQAKDRGPDVAYAALDAAADAWNATVTHIERSANDPRTPEGLKSVLDGLSALINPQDPNDLKDLENQPAVQRRVKQIVDKTAGQVKPQQQSDDGVIDAEFEEEPT